MVGYELLMADRILPLPFATIRFGIVYFIATASVVAWTRFEGGVAFIWIAGAILTARLLLSPVSEWGRYLAVCALGGIATTTLFGFGLAAAIPTTFVNLAEATIGALLLRRMVGRRAMLDSLQWLGSFVLACGIIAPAFAALALGSIASAVTGRPILDNILAAFSGHALGTLTFMPIAMVALRGEIALMWREAGREARLEKALLLGFVALVSVGTFAQDRWPILFLPMLPITLAIFRGGKLAAAASIMIVSTVGTIFTALGHGPIGLIGATPGGEMQFLQLYLAATMLTALPVTAELERRAELFKRLSESEARYRLVTDHSTDIVLNLDRDGIIRFISSSVLQASGRCPDELLGQHVSVLVDEGDRDRLTNSYMRAMEVPTGVTISEYRGQTADGETRWFETHSRAVLDAAGEASGIVSAIRDVTARKRQEDVLSRAAMTDPLTSVANRRAFDETLAARIGSGSQGCVALFDLDHFKRINDQFGHAAGDAVLARFAKLARSTLRDQDLVARIGGEEFAIILPDATLQQAQMVCERLRRTVAGAVFEFDTQMIAVTVSGGVASYAPGMAPEEPLRAADMALYQAKAAGRDRLALAA